MDKKLLEAMNNLSFALEHISDVLKEANNSKKEQSATTTAMSSGDFGVQLKEISADIKQIKSDTQELLKKQKTITDIQKQKGDEKSVFEKVGGDKKSESAMKKGVGTIILIAVAVLAIGLAFKLVGKIDFLSVISLGIAIVLISKAFKDVAELKLSLREAGIAALSMVMMAAAVTASSWILSLVKPITMPKLLTGIAITAMFAVMAPKVAAMIKAISPVASASVPGTGGLLNAKIGGAGLGSIGKVFLMLIGLSAVITASSWILKRMAILTPFQMVTGVAITAMFHVAGPKFADMAKRATGILGFGGISWMSILKVNAMLVGMSMAIVASSHILTKMAILTPFQMITAIAITGMFWMMGNFMPRLAVSVIAVSRLMGRSGLAFLPILMVAMSTAVMLSSRILTLTSPLTLMQMLTTALITGLFWLMAQFLPRVAMSVIAVDKLLGKGKLFLIPLVFIAMAAAIAGAGLLFSVVPAMSWKQMISVLVIGLIFAGLSYVMPYLAAGIYIMEKKVGKNKMWLIPLVFIALATAILVSALILENMPAIGFTKLLKILAFSVVMAVSMAVLGIVAAVLVKRLGVKNALKAVIIMVALATAIYASSIIMGEGNYGKYPSWQWALSTGLSLGIFGAVAYGLFRLPGASGTNYIKGAVVIVIIAVTILAVAKLLSMGNYGKFPSPKWSLGVGLALLVIGGAMIGLGYLMMADGGASLLLGTIGLAVVAFNIVKFSQTIAGGKYDVSKVPSKEYLKNVGLTLLLFGGSIIGLGMLILTGIGALALLAGGLAVLGIAKLVVETADILGKGNYSGGPTDQWVRASGRAIATFTDVVMSTGWKIVLSLGIGGKAIGDGIDATLSIAEAIQASSHTLAKGNYKGGPSESWAKGVAIAMKAFWPIYEMLVNSQAWYAGFLGTSNITPQTFSDSIGVVVGGIVSAAKLLNEQPDIWKMGPTAEWARGVAISMKAFWPIYEMLIDSQAWYSGFTGTAGITPDKFNSAIGIIVGGIVSAADRFAEKKGIVWKNGPTVEWAKGVGKAVKAFAPVYAALVESSSIWSRRVTADDLSYAITAIVDSIIVAAEKFANNTAPFAEGNYPKKEWGKNVGAAVKAFVPVFTAISEQSGLFTNGREAVDDLVYGIVSVVGAIVTVAKKLKYATDAGVNWDIYPNKDWSNGVFGSITMYVETFVELKDMDYDVEDDVIPAVLGKMIYLAKQLHWSQKYFATDTTIAQKFMAGAKVATLKYFEVLWQANKGFSAKGAQNGLLAASSMVIFAKKMDSGKQYFRSIIDPTYMANMLPNVVSYLEMVKLISQSDGGLKGLIKGAVFGDPVSRMADGMTKLATAYGKMAVSLTKFARSLALIDEKKLQTFRGVNSEMLKKGAKMEQGSSGGVMSAASNLGGAVLNRLTSFVEPKTQKRDSPGASIKKQDAEKKGKHGFTHQQFDKMIEALNELVANTKSLDSFIQEARNSDDDT